MENRKAQAALEFLTTYAWAFIVILIVIGALAYFGILSPSNLLPNKCTAGSEFECVDWAISSSNNKVSIKLRNNVGESITTNFSVFSDSGAVLFSCNPDNVTNMTTGQQKDISVGGCNFGAAGMVKGEKRKVLFKLRYYTFASGASYPHEVNGEMYSVVD